MASFSLDLLETRILGCLIEKERITPENYPLSLNSLTAACNQSTNRDPVTAFDEKTVETGLDTLRQKKLVTVVFGAGSRVQKYRHNLLDHFALPPQELALLCVLMLRGPQTPGELRARTERMYAFKDSGEVEASLEDLAKDESQFVRVLPARAGQKEKRYVQVLSGEPEKEADLATVLPDEKPAPASSLESEVAALRRDFEQLRAEFAVFRQQFD